ncbi:MetQ/NlpA family ABC transporter substrate-binding protein [Niallia alba]|uniref:ABC transporter substrate-binding protein n=1 Tax=Niallia alba TaxID=2729105 RepID=UPI00399FC539
MKFTKKYILIPFILMILLTITACSETTGTAKNSSKKITFGLIGSIDAIPMIIAEEQGYFQKHDVNVELQTFKSAKDRDAAFQGGNLDGIISDLIAISLYNEAGFDVKITGSTTGSFVFLSNPSITDIHDLKGKNVIVSKNTSIEYTLDKALESVGLTAEDITKEEVPSIPTRLELLKNNQADAAVLPEPFVTMGLHAGLNELTSTDALNLDPFITAFTQESIEKKGSEIIAFYKAYDEAVDYLNTHAIDEYMDIVIEKIGYPEDLKNQIELPTFRKNSLANEEDIISAFDWLKSKNLLTKELNPTDVLSNIATK